MSTPVFPYLPGMSWPVERSIGKFDTTRQEAMSGKVVTFANRTQARYQYTVTIEAVDAAGIYANLVAYSKQTLEGFFNSLLGGASLFNFWDVDDNTAVTQGFGTGDGVTTTFQLARALSTSWSDYIYAPITSGGTVVVPSGTSPGTTNAPYTTVTVFDNGGAAGTYSVSSLGLVTFTTPPAPGHALTWTGCYYQLCRFDDDQMDLSKFMPSAYGVNKLSFTGVIP
jgi:hypothetical protein